jgi:hypothetical protein
MSCEKRPDCLSPTRVAPLALAALLALVSSEEGLRDVCILKVLATFFFLHHRADTPIIRPRASSEGDVFPPPGELRSETNDNSAAILLTYATPGPPSRRRRSQGGEVRSERFVHTKL